MSDHLRWALAWLRPITNHALGPVPAVSVARMGTVFPYALKCKKNNLTLSISSPCFASPSKKVITQQARNHSRSCTISFSPSFLGISDIFQKTSLALTFSLCWALSTAFLRCFCCCFGLFAWSYTPECFPEVKLRRGRLYLEFSSLRVDKSWISDRKNAKVW